MKKSRVLTDGNHFLSRFGTGIASYSRTLIHNIRDLGGTVGVLFGAKVSYGRNDSDLVLATQILGHEPPPNILVKALRTGGQLGRALLFPGRSITARMVNMKGLEVDAFEPPLPAFDQVVSASGVFVNADRVFTLTGKMTSIRLPDTFDVAHWSSPMPVRAEGVPNIYTIHDLIPLQYPYMVLDRGGRSARLHQSIAQSADLIVTVSEASKRQIVDLLRVPEERVAVTFQPVPPLPFLTREEAERLVRTVYGAKPGEYALFLGAIEPKKNLRRLVDAYLLAGLDIPLLIAGPLGWLYEEELALVDSVTRNALPMRLPPQEGLANAIAGAFDMVAPQPRPNRLPIQRLGLLPRRHVSALMMCAKFFVFPSIHEGFGLPVLEALQLGTPVLTSNTSSLPEVAGEAAVLVDPLDVSAMARRLRELDGDADLRAELSVRGPQQAKTFSPETYKIKLADAYAKVGITLSG
ncbi:MAG: glycosyltransferase family 4 protein [Phreatobacter sp.]|uniref:glycosyltransferase family 4 protein n=1 Tax=Phreatobacter sp. TaxID=1966341 RepID=UPI00403521C1